MSYSVWASPLLCSSVAVTLASKTGLTLVYCEALFNVCIHPPSDQTMIPNTFPSSLPHFKLRVSPPRWVDLKAYLKPQLSSSLFPFSSNASSTHRYRAHASLNPLVKYKLKNWSCLCKLIGSKGLAIAQHTERRNHLKCRIHTFLCWVLFTTRGKYII